MYSEADGSAKGAWEGRWELLEIHFSGILLIKTKMQYSVVHDPFPGLFSFNLTGWGGRTVSSCLKTIVKAFKQKVELMQSVSSSVGLHTDNM